MAQMSDPMRILVDRRPTNLRVQEKGEEGYCCDTVMCIEESSGFILSSEVMRPDDGDDAVAACAQKALDAVREQLPDRPITWVVRQERIADALASGLRGGNIRLVPGTSFGPWDEAYLSMDRHMGSGGAMLPYLWLGDITPEEIAELFQAAAACYRLKPWQFLTDADVLAIPGPTAGEPSLIVSVMGASGIARGIALFDSEGDVHRMMSDDERRADLVYASFERYAKVPHTVTTEAEQHGWVTARKAAFPMVMRVRKGEPVPCSGDDLRRVSAAFQALCGLAREYRETEGGRSTR
jgi:hypothetical protein